MKRRTSLLGALVIVTLAIVTSVAAQQHQPCLADDYCIIGCTQVYQYSIAGFSSMTDAEAFVSGLGYYQQDTARIFTFRTQGTHVIVAYRVLSAGLPVNTLAVGVTCTAATVYLRTYASIETAEVELNQLSAAERAGAAVLSVPQMPNDPSTHALLLFLSTASTTAQDPHSAGKR